MKNAKLFIRQGCGHCENVQKDVEGLTIIDVSEPEYAATGFVPNDVPLLQFGTVVLVGAGHINDFINAARRIK